jgi:hypothetical protein
MLRKFRKIIKAKSKILKKLENLNKNSSYKVSKTQLKATRIKNKLYKKLLHKIIPRVNKFILKNKFLINPNKIKPNNITVIKVIKKLESLKNSLSFRVSKMLLMEINSKNKL